MSHNKNFTVKRVSRTEIVKLINDTKGRFFTSTHVGKDAKPHTINGMRFKIQDNPLGYIKVHSLKNKGIRLVNPQTITNLSFGGVHYKVK